MGQALRKFEVVEGGSSIQPLRLIGEPIGEPLGNLEKWLSVDALAGLSEVTPRMVRKACEKGRWRGADLMICQVEIGRGGAGGMAPQVHVDSLPADLRTAWYAGQGIALHEAVDPATGETRMMPEDAAKNDPKWEERTAVATWRLNIIRPATKFEKGSPARKALLEEIAAQSWAMPDGKMKPVSRSTLYNWMAAYDAKGFLGLMPDQRKDKGRKKVAITQTWDQFFSGRIDPADQRHITDTLTRYIRSLWASGESGWRAVTEKSTTRLIEVSRDLRDVQFDALPLGRMGSRGDDASQFGVCFVNRRLAKAQRDFGIIAIKTKDNARYQDTIAPTIRRDYSQLKPREIVVGDVHPTDIMILRPDGSRAYPKAISWFDPSTNEIHMTLVLLEKGEGAGIVRLSNSVLSASETTAATSKAVKSANDNAEARALKTTKISGGGLATGGGALSADRTITLPRSTAAQARAGEDDAAAMTPLLTKLAIDAQVPLSLRAMGLRILDANLAVENGVYQLASTAANRPPGAAATTLTVSAYSADFVEQQAYEVTPSAAADTLTWRRTKTNGAWSAWYRCRVSEAEIAGLSPAVIADSGWQRLPSGLIIQWLYRDTYNSETFRVTFPIAFPTAAGTIIAAHRGTAPRNYGAAIISASQADIYAREGSNPSTSTNRFNAIVIGY